MTARQSSRAMAASAGDSSCEMFHSSLAEPPRDRTASFASKFELQDAFQDNMFISDSSPSRAPVEPAGLSLRIMKIHGTRRHILSTTFVAVAPILSFGAVLLYLVLLSGANIGRIVDGLNAGYFHLAQTDLSIVLLFASLSTIATILCVNSFLCLFSYCESDAILGHSRALKLDSLLRPYEFALLISLLHGNFSDWWSGVTHCLRGKYKDNARKQILRVIGLMLLLWIACSLLIAADIWLHISSRQTQMQLPNWDLPGVYKYGRNLQEECIRPIEEVAPDGTFVVPLDQPSCIGRIDLIFNTSEVYNIVDGTSSLNTISQVHYQGSLLSMLTDAQAPMNSAFVASTYGVQTACTPVGSDCVLYPANDTFQCSQKPGTVDKTLILRRSNQVIGTHHQAIRGDTQYSESIKNDPGQKPGPNIVKWIASLNIQRKGGSAGNSQYSATLMECASELFHMRYFQVEGRNTVIDVTAASAQWTAAMFNPLLGDSTSRSISFGADIISEAMDRASRSAKTIQDFADAMSLSFSRTSIASSVGMSIPMTNIHDGIDSFVTLVPKIPVFCVIIIDFLYGLGALVLGIVAFVIVVLRPNVREVKPRLSTMGVIARGFEQDWQRAAVSNLRDLFAETDPKYGQLFAEKRVRIVPTAEGGWSWEST
ncbi:hypothetical protein K402DRAFT_16890 [Aulographum hederae CBS 113979]|uniref:Uncharacterized protein n=1 Tax=Aulographum hederae CBS 113979 TaxID=1176131 RepID=A0A6G1H7M2_9PEZI|nr:hypothetical protein K402DRAFT_16890 [Aulographum hederae CBS 113979]